MSKFADYDFKADAVPLENEFISGDFEYVPIYDSNNNNYSSGQVSWNNVAMCGGGSSSENAQWYLSQAYVVIPVSRTLTAVGGTFQLNAANVPSNINALSLKSNIMAVETAWVKMGGQSVSNNAQYNYLLLNEKLKTASTDEAKVESLGRLNHIFDSVESYKYVATGLTGCQEVNNCSNLNANDWTMPANQQCNKAIYERNKKFFDCTAYNDPTQSQFAGVAVNPFNQLVSSATGTVHQLMQPHFINDDDNLIWNDLVILKLSDIHDFFANTPSVSSLQGFELKLQTPFAAQNSYTVAYADIQAGGIANLNSTTPANFVHYKPTAVSANQAIGSVCPFLLSSASNSARNLLGSGLVMTQTTAGTGITLSVKSQIGWVGTGSQTVPCRLMIPMAKLTTHAVAQIYKQPAYRVLFDDCFIDQIQIVPGNVPVQKPLATQFSRMKKIWLIPFLHGAVPPYQSLLSSAPITPSFAKFKNVQISIGGRSIFQVQPLNYSYDFYDSNAYHMLSKFNGNSAKSTFKSGQVKACDFSKLYNSYCFDIERVLNEEDFMLQKSLQVSFTIDAPNAITYDVFVLVEHQAEIHIDRVSGAIAQ
jgi:hypothetical protein